MIVSSGRKGPLPGLNVKIRAGTAGGVMHDKVVS